MSRLCTPALALALLLPAVAVAHEHGSRPAMPSLTEKEEVRLAEGKLVLRTQRDESKEGAATITGIIEIAATPQKIWAILLDFESIPETSGAMKDADRYFDNKASPHRVINMKYHVKVAWVDIYYHVHHDYLVDQNYLVWTLDSTRENDIEATVGSFSTWPGSSPSRTRFLYRTLVDTGRSVPKWVEEDLSESSLKSYIKHVKEAAEK